MNNTQADVFKTYDVLEAPEVPTEPTTKEPEAPTEPSTEEPTTEPTVTVPSTTEPTTVPGKKYIYEVYVNEVDAPAIGKAPDRNVQIEGYDYCLTGIKWYDMTDSLQYP